METSIKDAWERCQDDVRQELQSIAADSEDSWGLGVDYKTLAQIVCRHLSDYPFFEIKSDELWVKRNGSYHGTMIMVAPIHFDKWFVSGVYYGSSSGCDALAAATSASDLFRICLTIVQNAHIVDPGPMYYHEACRKREAGIQTCPRCNGTGECKKEETEETTDE